MLHHAVRIWKFEPRRYQLDEGWQNKYLGAAGEYLGPRLGMLEAPGSEARVNRFPWAPWPKRPFALTVKRGGVLGPLEGARRARIPKMGTRCPLAMFRNRDAPTSTLELDFVPIHVVWVPRHAAHRSTASNTAMTSAGGAMQTVRYASTPLR